MEPSTAPCAIALVDQPTLLAASTLRLSKDLRAADARADRVVVKYLPGRRYLVLSPLQWRALQAFGDGRTVPSVLFELIAQRRSIPLREFYEIIIKAFNAGILQVDHQPLPPAVTAYDWRARASGRPVRWLSVIAMAAAIITILVRPVQLPEHVGHLLAGWLLTCAATSVGYALAACVLRGSGCEIHSPQFIWRRTLAPRFQADLGDVIMGGRDAETDSALVRLAPQFVITAVAAVYWPAIVFPLLCGLLVLISPLWRSPMLDLLRGLYGEVRLATTYDFMFMQNQLFSVFLKARMKFADRRFLRIAAGYTLAWFVLLFLTGCALLEVNALDLLRRFNAAGGLHFTALALLVTLGLMAVSTVGMLGWIGWKHVSGWWQAQVERRRRPVDVPVEPATIEALLKRTLLFQKLAPEDITTISQNVRAEEHVAGSFVVREAEPGDTLYIVFSGRIEVVRELAVGRPEPVAELREGDVFGEIALLVDGTRHRSVRCITRSVLLAIGKADFQRLVLSRLSRHTIEEAVQKVAFLQRIPLSKHWSPHAMAAFARRAAFQDFKEGDTVIHEGRDNTFFYLIYEGELSVLKSKKEVARLVMGNFFGEISLLQNSIATATIVAASSCRCLLVSKHEFLNFMTQDFTIGLQFEDISSKRLGEPIFPLRGASIDTIRR
jgi:CRP-like cAMP-binding protein